MAAERDQEIQLDEQQRQQQLQDAYDQGYSDGQQSSDGSGG
jgi:hypothetical protein